MNNLYLFTGEETYLLSEQLHKWKKAFVAKHGDLNMITLNGKEVEVGEMIADMSALPFLAEKRLILIENLPEASKGNTSENSEESDAQKDRWKPLIDFLPKIPESSVVVFVQPAPDKRKAFYKALAKIAEVKEFNRLDGNPLHQWIAQKVHQHGAQIEAGVIPYLVRQTGPDLWRLSQEAEKLSTYKKGERITREDIDLLVVPTIEANIFHLTDALGSRDHHRGIQELHRSMGAGVELRQVFYMIVRQFRIFLLIRGALKQRPYSTPAELATQLRLHPFVIRSTQAQAKHFDDQQLVSAYEKLLMIDVGLKTSQIKTTTDNQNELALVIERFIIDFCG